MPYSLVYGMEEVLQVEIKLQLLRIILEAKIPEAEWARSRNEELNLLDEKRLRATFNMQLYQ